MGYLNGSEFLHICVDNLRVLLHNSLFNFNETNVFIENI